MSSLARSWLRVLLILGLPLAIFAIAAGLEIREGSTTVAAIPTPSLSVILRSEPAVPPAEPAPVVTETPANRADCNQIRGSAYQSDDERDWFRANCSNSAANGGAPLLASARSDAGPLARGGRAATAAISLPPADLPLADTPSADVDIYGTADRLVIKRLSVDAPVNVRLVEPDGVLGNPIAGKDVVLYDFSTMGASGYGGYPGLGGNTVIAGHVDYICCLAVFNALRSIQEGDLIDYMTSDGQDIQYQVQWYADYPDDTSWNQYVAMQGKDDTMTLLTCNGTFNQATHNYDSRRIVRAPRVQ